jgi:hypothetical protein
MCGGEGGTVVEGSEKTERCDPKFYLDRAMLSTGPEGLEYKGAMASAVRIGYNFGLFAIRNILPGAPQ